jgi:predicted GNAT family acetyltransferase
LRPFTPRRKTAVRLEFRRSDLSEVRDNTQLHRYETVVDGVTAFVAYERAPGTITFVHTEVPKELSGRGVGSLLAKTVLDAARQDGLKVNPECPFIAAYIEKHPEYRGLVVKR